MTINNKRSSDKLNFHTVAILTVLFMGTVNIYWLTMMNVPNMAGGKFMNGISCGVAELSSGILSGVIVSYLSVRTTFQMSGLFGIVFSVVNEFLVIPGSAFSYITLFLLFCGVGGLYNLIFILVNINVPTEHTGSIMNFSYSIANFSALGVPFIILLDAPLPFYIQQTILLFLLLLTFNIANDARL